MTTWTTMSSSETGRKTVAQIAEERGDFIMNDAGDVVWWPLDHRGYLTADALRELAGGLDRRNREVKPNDHRAYQEGATA